MTKTISARQLGLIAFLSVLSLKLTVLPALFYAEIRVDTIISLLIITSIDFAEFFLIYYVLKKNQNISFYEFLYKKIGKFFAKIIFMLIFIFYFFKMLLLCGGGFNYASSAIFREAPMYLFLFILLTASSSLYLFKSRSFARTVEFFYPLIATMMIIFIFISLLTAPLQDIRPFFETPISKIFETSFYFSILGGNYIFMLMFMGKIKFSKNSKRTLVSKLIFGWVLLMAFYTINYSIFKFTASAHPHAISEIIQYLPFPSVLGNFDWFAVSFMLILFVFHGGLFTYCMTYSLNYIVESKKIIISDSINKLNLIITNILLLIFIYIIFPTFPQSASFVFQELFVPIISCVVLVIPIICFFIELIKKKNKNFNKLIIKGEKNEEN